jgi:hypothetical protein
MLVNDSVIGVSSIFAQAYGTGTYSCGAYDQGCTTSGTSTTPSAPNTGMLLSEPSFVIPGSLLIAVILAIITTSIAKLLRRKRARQ